MARVTVGLFGGSFNPPHIGHVLAAAYVLSAGLVERVVAVPVFAHALGKALAPFPARVAMARLAFEWLPGVEVSEVEQELGSPSRTLRTIEALCARHPDWQLRLIVGSDILGELHQWHAYAQIERLAPPLILPRPGAPDPARTAEAARILPDISSTEVRASLAAAAQGNPDAGAQLRQVVPAAVLAYIQQQGLYGVAAP